MGWRGGRGSSHAIALAPDWVCEVFSPSTHGYQVLIKRLLYARSGVPFLGEIDRERRILSVRQLESGRWMVIGSYSEEEDARLLPFDAIALNVKGLWLAS